jgi:hypothetical protein
VRALVILALLCGCAAPQPERTSPPRDLAAEASVLTIGKSTKDDALAALGEGDVIEFDSGYEVWVYRQPGAEKPSVPAAELVLLFQPSGVLSKTRVR